MKLRELVRSVATTALLICSSRAIEGAAAQPAPTTLTSVPVLVPYTRFTPAPTDLHNAERDACSSTLCYALLACICLLFLAAGAVLAYYCCTRRKTRVEFRLTEPDVDTSPSIDLSQRVGKVRVLFGGQLGSPKDFADPLSAIPFGELQAFPLPTSEVVAESLRDWPNPSWWIMAMVVDVRGGPLHLPFGVWSCVGAQTAGERIHSAPTPAVDSKTKDVPTACFQLRLQGLAQTAATPTVLKREGGGLSSGSEGEGQPISNASSIGTKSGGSGSESTTSTLPPPPALISFRSTGSAADGGGPFVVEGFINRDTCRFVSRKSYTSTTQLEFGTVQLLGDELRLAGRWICLKPEPASGFLVYRVSMPPPMIITSTVANGSITSPGNGSFAIGRGGEGPPTRPMDRIDSPLLAGAGKGVSLERIEI